MKQPFKAEKLEGSLQTEVHLPNCPNCGAPLPLRRVYRGAVDCEYCGLTVALRSPGPLAAASAVLEGVECRVPLPPYALVASGIVILGLAMGRKWK